MTFSRFIDIVWKFYRDNGRSFPWRKTHDPYCIFVSEIMLQQTQADRVVEKYRAFIKKYKTVNELARASQRDVLTLWQGLGYNRRALYLMRAAKIITEEYQGKFPKTIPELTALPGIGPYTARAILTFAYNIPSVFIETNIRTVYLYSFFKNAQPKSVSDSVLIKKIEKTVDSNNPREWYSALMDYGTMLKKTKKIKNTASKTYIKQKSFIGSRRQLRGAILRTLVKESSVTLKKISEILKDDTRIQDELISLEKEGFILNKKNTFSLVY
jgi:A/G-specific adenine glycosylase